MVADSMMVFDNSKPGNDCYITEKWYWIPEFNRLLRCVRVSGYRESDFEISDYKCHAQDSSEATSEAIALSKRF